MRGNRGGNPCIEAPGNVLQLAAGVARILDVANGDHDLDVGGQQAHALQPVNRRGCDPTDGGGRHIEASLREAQKRQARLGFQAKLACAAIRLLGRRELPFQAMDLGLLVERPGGSPAIDTPRPHAGSSRLVDRLRPRALELHDLGPMDLAGADEGDHVGLSFAPLRKGGGPFAGTVDRIHLLTGADDAAVHQAGHERRQLPSGDRDHGLVQEGETGLDLPLLQASSALLMAGAGNQIGIAAALADRGGGGRSGVRGVEVVCIKALLDHRQQQVPSLRAL